MAAITTLMGGVFAAGDQDYLFQARQMSALFAVGVVTGTILRFELGVLWPEFMASFGNVSA